MKITVQIVLHADDDTETVVREAFTVQRGALAPETLGLQLEEAKDLLSTVQDTLVEHQVAAAMASAASCPDCGIPHRHKDSRPIVIRTLFGTLRLGSPRLWHCPCQARPARTFSPLAVTLRERTTPELSYLQTRFAGLVSYGLSADMLSEVLPLGRVLHATTVRRQLQATAQRLENELGDEQPSFITGCPAEWAELPRPDLPLVVGLDGGYVHSCTQRTRRDGWFEVIAGKTMPADGGSCCFGYVQTYDTKPKRRLFEVLAAQGMQANQQVTFLTDGGEDIRDLPRYLNPQAEHLLDWFHLTMRITVLTQLAKGLRVPPELSATLAAELQRLKWFLWHGNVFRSSANRRRHHHRPRRRGHRRPARQGPARQTRQGGTRVRRVPRRERRGHTQLRGALPRRRDHLHLVRGIRGQPGHQQTHGQEAADALESPRRASTAPDPHPGPQRHPRRRLPALVPRLHPHPRPAGPSRVASHGLSRSHVRGAFDVTGQGVGDLALVPHGAVEGVDGGAGQPEGLGDALPAEDLHRRAGCGHTRHGKAFRVGSGYRVGRRPVRSAAGEALDASQQRGVVQRCCWSR